MFLYKSKRYQFPNFSTGWSSLRSLTINPLAVTAHQSLENRRTTMLLLTSLTLPASVFSAPKLFGSSICKQPLNTGCSGSNGAWGRLLSFSSALHICCGPPPSGKIQREEASNSEAPALAPLLKKLSVQGLRKEAWVFYQFRLMESDEW